MDSRSTGGVHLVRLDRGEDVLGSLVAFLDERSISSGTVTGIGAVGDVEVGAYLSAEARYEKTRLEGEWELVGFTGTIALVDGKPSVHPHVVLGNARAEVRGGHLFGARIAVTGEFEIREAGIAVSRELDPAIGLKLWRFG
jgi:predicted DNA-binding protein with PD1-like motif